MQLNIGYLSYNKIHLVHFVVGVSIDGETDEQTDGQTNQIDKQTERWFRILKFQ